LLRTTGLLKRGLEAELDKFTVWPEGMEPQAQGAA
jgi:hypothetical protein